MLTMSTFTKMGNTDDSQPLQSATDFVGSWAEKWGLPPTSDGQKTHFLMIGPKSQAHSPKYMIKARLIALISIIIKITVSIPLLKTSRIRFY